ncbi:hypothetical protein COLO4_22585 [Corchorus olitorius]|uniref:non-specific serine/threonine protein kinase n=1 Tax=Corchorus olitorius TaxID=93759 RepID=A0A1R3ILA9_9ROSI|nr:hypothetical protein COLO4_22585 [Corchorus olitorius]
MCSSLLAYLLILSQALFQVSCLEFNFSKFEKEDDEHLILSKDSYIALTAIQVTPDVNGASMENLSGRALYKTPFRLYKGNGSTMATFNTTFVLNILSQTSPGGEGLAFIITGDSSLPENSQGKWLGIVNENSNGSSQARVVAVEFDTRKSDDADDVDDNHVGLNINSIHSTNQVSLTRYGFNISGGVDLRVFVGYDGKNLTVIVNEIPILSEPLDLFNHLPEEVYVGFSASTSNYTELNCVKSWEFSGIDIGGEGRNWKWIIRIVVPIAGVSLLVVTAVVLCLRRAPEDEDLEGGRRNIEDQITRSNLAPKKFRLKELKQATGNFSPKNKLGKGGFGTVYKGTWKNKDVAVKRVSKKSHQGKQEFIAEVTTIGNLNHKNLVKLIGWKGRITDAADSKMDGKFEEKEVECVLILGLACCHPNPHYRPSMKTVLQVLSGEAEPPQIPQERPSFVWPAMPPSFSKIDDSLTGSQLTPFTELTDSDSVQLRSAMSEVGELSGEEVDLINRSAKKVKAVDTEKDVGMGEASIQAPKVKTIFS